MKRLIRVGSRESKLAVVQSQIVMDAIKKLHPEFELELVTMKSTGDMILDVTLDKIGGKGLFIKELEQALLKGEVDICVHSYKDIPMEENPLLPIVAVTEREDPRDVLILPKGCGQLDFNKPIGSSSTRRIMQLQGIYPEARFAMLRGNILTRISKLDEGEFCAIILAYAGIRRLMLDSRVSRIFEADEILPAASQGILAVQGRAGEDYSYLQGLHSKESEYISAAERAFIRALGGGCTQPSAAYAITDGVGFTLRGMYVHEETGKLYFGSCEGDTCDAEALGGALAADILRRTGECS